MKYKYSKKTKIKYSLYAIKKFIIQTPNRNNSMHSITVYSIENQE